MDALLHVRSTELVSRGNPRGLPSYVLFSSAFEPFKREKQQPKEFSPAADELDMADKNEDIQEDENFSW
ncbi:hypothetical protein HHI36_001830, partial [Cryptolaemus montrouzieri]